MGVPVSIQVRRVMAGGDDDRHAVTACEIEDLLQQSDEAAIPRPGEPAAEAHVDHVGPVLDGVDHAVQDGAERADVDVAAHLDGHEDRKSTRLNSSHSQISYAVFCLKKKKINPYQYHPD